MTAAQQTTLFSSTNGAAIHLLDVDINQCRHSRFNTRKTRDQAAIDKLADRIRRMGFERTRAPKAVPTDDGGYEVFAGGTRLEAAKAAAVTTLPIYAHVGLSDEAISRKADEDNESDEYHVKVSPVDVWAEYARLRDTERWTQQKIADVKGTTQPTVSERLRLHDLAQAYPKVAGFIVGGRITEYELRQILRISLSDNLAPWLAIPGLWAEVAEKVVHDKGKNGGKGDKGLAVLLTTWRGLVERAEQLYEELDAYPKRAWNLDGDEPVQADDDPAADFVAGLKKRKARTENVVNACADAIKKRLAQAARRYELWLEHRNAALARAAAEAEAREAVMAKFHRGDCVAALDAWQGSRVRLVLTDPPYGQEYRSNRRWASRAPERIAGDGKAEAMPLLAAALDAVLPHLADDAHVLIFCACDRQQEVRTILAACGLTVKDNDLIWAKEEHTAGDVESGFGPSHEHLIHAVKGRPPLRPRIRDVLPVARTGETKHPHEKPRALLKQLIESTTTEGDLVVDPFAGCASTLLAAYQAGRDFWGAEVEDDYYDEGSTRLLKQWEAQR